jgi:hypothetical protein
VCGGRGKRITEEKSKKAMGDGSACKISGVRRWSDAIAVLKKVARACQEHPPPIAVRKLGPLLPALSAKRVVRAWSMVYSIFAACHARGVARPR